MAGLPLAIYVYTANISLSLDECDLLFNDSRYSDNEHSVIQSFCALVMRRKVCRDKELNKY